MGPVLSLYAPIMQILRLGVCRFHHIKSLTKRKHIVGWGKELHLAGWSKPGYPGQLH